MANRIIIIVNTPTSASAIEQDRSDYLDVESRAKEFLNKLSDKFGGMAGGLVNTKVEAGAVAGSADAVSSSFTATFSAVPADADTLTIGGTVITFVDGAPGNNEVQRDDAPSNATLASRLADAINDSTTAELSGLWSASASDDAVTISFKIPGIVGNQFEATESAAGLALSGLTSDKPTNGVGSFPSLTTFRFGY